LLHVCLLLLQELLAKGSIMKVLKIAEEHNKGFAAQVGTVQQGRGVMT
jgi:hypothetical protein